MIEREVALEALSVLCNANVTSVQTAGGAAQQTLSINNFIPTVLHAEETSQVSRSNFAFLQSTLQGAVPEAPRVNHVDIEKLTGRNHIIDENEFFDPRFDYDFTELEDTETYTRGGEVYERPCGWQRFGLKVLDKYDGNTWLGNQYRSTQSVPGEWPVSYHGTSKEGAEGIIEGFYKPGSRDRHGRGVYSTPHISVARHYTSTFISKTGKTYRVILQNRVNPEFREIHNNNLYWLVQIPDGKSEKEEQAMIERAIRPYGLLLKEV